MFFAIGKTRGEGTWREVGGHAWTMSLLAVYQAVCTKLDYVYAAHNETRVQQHGVFLVAVVGPVFRFERTSELCCVLSWSLKLPSIDIITVSCW